MGRTGPFEGLIRTRMSWVYSFVIGALSEGTGPAAPDAFKASCLLVIQLTRAAARVWCMQDVCHHN